MEQNNMNLGPYKTVEPAIEQANRDYAFYMQSNLSQEEMVLIEDFRGGRRRHGHGGHGGHGRYFRPWRPLRRPWVGGYVDPQPVYYPIHIQNSEAVQCRSAEQCQLGEYCDYRNENMDSGFCRN